MSNNKTVDVEDGIKSIRQILEEVSEDICDNYCKYKDTCDEAGLCEKIKAGENCPLDRLYRYRDN